MRTLAAVAGGPAVDVELSSSALGRLERTSARVERALQLGFSPIEATQDKLRVRGIVGTLPLGGMAIDIVPEPLVDAPDWRTQLAGTLADRYHLDWNPWFESSNRDETLADHFAHSVYQAILAGQRFGMPRQYVERHRHLNGVRGQVDVSNIWRSAVHVEEGLGCRYSELVDEHPVVMLLSWTARRLADMVSIGWLSSQLRELTAGMPEPKAPDRFAPPIQPEQQYAHLADAVNIGNLLAHAPYDEAMVWSESSLWPVSAPSEHRAVGI